MPLRAKNAVVLAKIESTDGTDSSPVASANAIRCRNIAIAFAPNLIETDEVTGSLDPLEPIVGGMKCQIDFEFLLKGATAGAGSPPEFSPIMKACGLSEVLTATAIPVAAEAATAGTAISLTLSAGATATAQLYRGMPLLLTVNPVSGTTFIQDYTAGKLATLTDTFSPVLSNTTLYQIPANVLYSPSSGTISSVTQWIYIDGIAYKFTGCVGDLAFTFPTGAPAFAKATMHGMFEAKVDLALASPTYDVLRAPVDKGGVTVLDRLAIALQTMTLGLGNTVAFPDDPNQLEGFGTPVVTARKMRGQINPLEVNVATRDIMSLFRNGTKSILHKRFGTAVGNRIGVTIPAATYINQTPNQREQLATTDVPFHAGGINSGMFLCIY